MSRNTTIELLTQRAELPETSTAELAEIFQDLGTQLRDPGLRTSNSLHSNLPNTLSLFNNISELKKEYGLQAKIVRYLVNFVADNNDNRELLISQSSVSASFFKNLSETLLLNSPISSQDENKDLLILFVLHLLQNLIIDNAKTLQFIRSFHEGVFITNIINASHSIPNSDETDDDDEENSLYLDLLLQLNDDSKPGKFIWVRSMVNYLNETLPRPNTTLRCQIGLLEKLTKHEELQFTNTEIQEMIPKLFNIFMFLETDNRKLWQDESDDDNEEGEESSGDQQMVWEKWFYVIMNLSANKNNLNDRLTDYFQLLDTTVQDIETETPNYVIYIMMNNFITSKEKRDEFYELFKSTNIFQLYHRDISNCLACKNGISREPILLQSLILANKLLLIGDYAKTFDINLLASGLNRVSELSNEISLSVISKYLQSLQVNNIAIDQSTKNLIFLFLSNIEMNFKNYKGTNLIGLNLINYTIMNKTHKIDEIETILQKINYSMDRLELDLIVEKSKTMGLLLSDQELVKAMSSNKWFTKSLDELRSMVENDQFKRQGGNPILLNNYKFINSKLEKYK